MEDMVKMAAESSEEERKTILTQRLNMLAEMPPEQCATSIADLLKGVAKLDSAKRKAFIKTRWGVIFALPEAKRKAILVGRIKAGKIVGEEMNKAHMQESMEVLKSEYPADVNQNFRKSLQKVANELGAKLPL